MKESEYIFSSLLGLFILGCLVAPIALVVFLVKEFIVEGLRGPDGVIDAHELRIGLGYGVTVLFGISNLFMLFTSNALKWHFNDVVYLYNFLGMIGAESTTIMAIMNTIENFKLRKNKQ